MGLSTQKESQILVPAAKDCKRSLGLQYGSYKGKIPRFRIRSNHYRKITSEQ